MKMTPVAAELIHRLRNDKFTRNHFNMGVWINEGCGTVGCLAGTAMLIEADEGKRYDEVRLLLSRANNSFLPGCSHTVIQGASRILGLDQRAGRELFLPGTFAYNVTVEDTVTTLPERDAPWLLEHPYYMETYGPNERPGAEQVRALVKWGIYFRRNRFTSRLGPDECADALERTLMNESPYARWAAAEEEMA